MPKIMLKKQHYARLILVIFYALFPPWRQKDTSIGQKHNVLPQKLQFYKQ